VNIRIHETVLTTIAAHARREAPNECCGLLVGAGDLIDEAVATRNLLTHPSRYQIDPEEHIGLNRRLRGTARAVVGAYHSHPRTEAIPSPRDIAEAHYPEFVWLIVSLAGDRPQFGAYRITESEAIPMTLSLVTEINSQFPTPNSRF
jgi:proteasome lid subunit RPN8/RPN11